MDRLFVQQWFRLTFWKFATQEINYRRFFHINQLISVKIEEGNVFHHVHKLVLDIMKEGKISWLRINYIEGLYDPTKY